METQRKGRPVRFPSLILSFVLWSPACGLAAPAGTALPPTDARRFVMPIYVDGQSAPVAVLRIEQLATEYEKRGLFRVGLLPKTVLTGVSVELDSVERLPAALAHLQRIIEHSRREHAWELRLVRVTVRRQPVTVLAVGRVTPDGLKAWRLENLSQQPANGPARTLATGRLRADGQLELEAQAGPVPLLDWLAGELSTRGTSNP